MMQFLSFLKNKMLFALLGLLVVCASLGAGFLYWKSHEPKSEKILVPPPSASIFPNIFLAVQGVGLDFAATKTLLSELPKEVILIISAPAQDYWGPEILMKGHPLLLDGFDFPNEFQSFVEKNKDNLEKMGFIGVMHAPADANIPLNLQKISLEQKNDSVLILKMDPSTEDIHQFFESLTKIAQEKGSVLGILPLYPVLIDRVQAFGKKIPFSAPSKENLRALFAVKTG
jgi:hypothetical protein